MTNGLFFWKYDASAKGDIGIVHKMRALQKSYPNWKKRKRRGRRTEIYDGKLGSEVDEK